MQINLAVKAGPHQGAIFEFKERANFVVGRSDRAHFRLPDFAGGAGRRHPSRAGSRSPGPVWECAGDAAGAGTLRDVIRDLLVFSREKPVTMSRMTGQFSRFRREGTIMSSTTRLAAPEEIEYPESDGEPMAENTDQYDWITKIKGDLEIVFRDDPNVFVAGDLFWYPVEGNNTIRRAPDVMVALGRPKGRRGCLSPVARSRDRAPGRLRDPLARQSRGGAGPQVSVLRDVRGRGILHLRSRRQHARRLAPRGGHAAEGPQDEWLEQSPARGPLRARR